MAVLQPTLPHSRPSWCSSTDAHKTGVAQEVTKAATTKLKGMTTHEAQLILGVKEGAPWPEVVQVSSSHLAPSLVLILS